MIQTAQDDPVAARLDKLLIVCEDIGKATDIQRATIDELFGACKSMSARLDVLQTRLAELERRIPKL